MCLLMGVASAFRTDILLLRARQAPLRQRPPLPLPLSTKLSDPLPYSFPLYVSNRANHPSPSSTLEETEHASPCGGPGREVKVRVPERSLAGTGEFKLAFQVSVVPHIAITTGCTGPSFPQHF